MACPTGSWSSNPPGDCLNSLLPNTVRARRGQNRGPAPRGCGKAARNERGPLSNAMTRTAATMSKAIAWKDGELWRLPGACLQPAETFQGRDHRSWLASKRPIEVGPAPADGHKLSLRYWPLVSLLRQQAMTLNADLADCRHLRIISFAFEEFRDRKTIHLVWFCR